ncbi:Transcriptional regulatory protein DegU [Starkeya nomas]|uniref:Transcriptional regulatory protein DegU n=1 Tax=Starkeya nomas TaxID=2666134 RepID=A0A5S9P7E0_9HYPH|nr:Transcriptional regulatory protein DegU [Starkeya nomas]
MTEEGVEKAGCVSIVLLDDLPLRRASIKSLLRDWALEERVSLDTIEADSSDRLDHIERRPELLVYNSGYVATAVGEWRARIDRLRQALPDVPLVIISEGDNAHEVIEALKAGVRGFISAQMPPAIVFQALRFILGGGVYFPPSALLQAQAGTYSAEWRRTGPTTVTARYRVQCSGLTERQAAVWRLLQHGHSNKVIARELSMCESTVKVHMRQIMRKLGATNRTQAALCSVEAVSGNEEADAAVGGLDEPARPCSLAGAEPDGVRAVNGQVVGSVL